ncbi:IPT/TIG domain-containing protein [Patescibacteria group bacterium]|nr:IPT/TIG domain-containing protein [Patescibacteria group bacterium]MBU1673060.1 IPT/TIG domain-containing protein [Patescibacteria group bacterium]MBU1963666.1 IPT/TIG domain-containing protein [Patescibacteria group bacterium]
MINKLIQITAALIVGIFFAVSANAAVIWHEDMEAGPGAWGTTGFWHLQEDPQNQHVKSYLYNIVVQLPDAGYLPEAYSGSHAWWYGQTANGTFIGNPYPAPQGSWSGGTSHNPNTGNLTTPNINLNGQSKATLSFWTWWEINGVDSDLYDMMYVDVWTSGSGWHNLGNINPAEDVDAPPYKPYSSGGIGQTGIWINPKFDLTPYAGMTIKLRFRFDTVDTLYNAFRGWMIDDVKITNKQILPSFKNAKVTAKQECSGFLNGAINKPTVFSIKNAQAVSITSNQQYSISKYGNHAWVCSDKQKCFLPSGKYILWANFNSGENCPSAKTSQVSVKFKKSNLWPKAGPSGSVMSIFGNKFTNGMKVFFNGNETNVNIISSHEAIAQVPALTDGIYDIVIQEKNNTVTRILKKAYKINNSANLEISGVSPNEINNDIKNSITITGTGFSHKTKITIGGVPLKNRIFNSDNGTITGTLPKGTSPGYQNIQVTKKSQVNTEVGAIKINNNSDSLYTGKKGKNLSKPNRIKKVRVDKIAPGTFKFSWKKRARTNIYKYRVKLDGNTIKKGKIKHPKHSKTLHPVFITQHLDQELKFQVRSQNKYGQTKWKTAVFVAN